MAVLLIMGIIAAIAIPMFFGLQAKAHQAETKVNLSRIHVAEVNYSSDLGRYGSFSETGFVLQGVSTRYTYRSPAVGGAAGSTNTPNVDMIVPAGGVASPENAVTASGASLPALGVPGSFTATATGNLDNDGTLDQWHIKHDKQGMEVPDIDDATL